MPTLTSTQTRSANNAPLYVPTDGAGDALVSGSLTVAGTFSAQGTSFLGGPTFTQGVTSTTISTTGAINSGGALTVGTVAANQNLSVNGSVNVTGSVDAAVSSRAGGFIGLLNGGPVPAAFPAGIVGGTTAAPVPASFLYGIGSLGSGQTIGATSGSVVIGGLLINYATGSTDSDGNVGFTFSRPYASGVTPAMATTCGNPGSSYILANIQQFSNVGAAIQVYAPDTGTPHHAGPNIFASIIAMGPVP